MNTSNVISLDSLINDYDQKEAHASTADTPTVKPVGSKNLAIKKEASLLSSQIKKLDPHVFKGFAPAHDIVTVDESPLYAPTGENGEMLPQPGKKGLFVENAMINVVSENYKVVQPLQVVKQFMEVAKQTDLKVNKILNNPNNGGLLISSTFEETRIAGEDHNVNVVFYTSHDGKYKTMLTLQTLRIACFNQVPTLYRDRKDNIIFSEKHYRNTLDVDLISKRLLDIPDAVQRYNEIANMLKSASMTKKQFIDFYINHAKIDTEAPRSAGKIAKIENIWQSGQGQELCGSDNMWRALNAVSYLNTHETKAGKFKNENVFLKNQQDTQEVINELVMLAN